MAGYTHEPIVYWVEWVVVKSNLFANQQLSQRTQYVYAVEVLFVQEVPNRYVAQFFYASNIYYYQKIFRKI